MKAMNLLYRCLRVALALKNAGNCYRFQKKKKVGRSKLRAEVEAKSKVWKKNGERTKRKDSRLDVKGPVVAVTEIVDTCVSSSWSIVFTLWLRKL